MKIVLSLAVYTAASLICTLASAQPVYQYNDHYTQPKSFLPPAEEDTVVHSSPPGHTLEERPLTEEEMRNAKPMGKYIDEPNTPLKPLPRGGNQPLPAAPLHSSAPGMISGDPGAPPQAMPGYPGVSENDAAPNSGQRKRALSNLHMRGVKPMERFITPPKGGDPVLPPGGDPLRYSPDAVALPSGTIRPMYDHRERSQ